MSGNKTLIKMLVLLVLLCTWGICPVGCGNDDDSGTDTDADTDTDTDADTDTDTDADTDTDVDTDTDTDTDGECELDPQRVYDDIAYFASDDLEGRETGAAGNETALVYTENIFENIGLEPAGDSGTYRQAFDAKVPSIVGTPKLSIGDTTFTYRSDFRAILFSGSGSLTSEIVFAGYGLVIPPFDRADYPECPLSHQGYSDFENIDMKGKIALVLRHGPNDNTAIIDHCPSDPATCKGEGCHFDFGYKAANARASGAAALLIAEDYQHQSHPGRHGLYLGEKYYDANFPALFVSRDKLENFIPDMGIWASRIDQELKPASRATSVTARMDVEGAVEKVMTANVVGKITGTDLASEAVVVGGHIDHLGMEGSQVYNGADDNASGTATAIELARMFSYCDIEPKRTVIFIAFNAEEWGLLGSYHYCYNPHVPLDQTVAMYNMDMVGDGSGTGIDLMGGATSQSQWLTDVMVNSAQEQGLSWSITTSGPQTWSDHACFQDQGIAVSYADTQGSHPFWHDVNDNMNCIEVVNLQATIELFWASLLPLAMGEEDNYTNMSYIENRSSEAITRSTINPHRETNR